MSDHFTIISVVMVKWGKKYGPEYVNRLAAGLLRNAPRNCSFQMICFTDDTAGVTSAVQCRWGRRALFTDE